MPQVITPRLADDEMAFLRRIAKARGLSVASVVRSMIRLLMDEVRFDEKADDETHPEGESRCAGPDEARGRQSYARPPREAPRRSRAETIA